MSLAAMTSKNESPRANFQGCSISLNPTEERSRCKAITDKSRFEISKFGRLPLVRQRVLRNRFASFEHAGRKFISEQFSRSKLLFERLSNAVEFRAALVCDWLALPQRRQCF